MSVVRYIFSRLWVRDPLGVCNLSNKKKKKGRINRDERMTLIVLSPLASHDPRVTTLFIFVVNLYEEAVITHVKWVFVVLKLHVQV